MRIRAKRLKNKKPDQEVLMTTTDFPSEIVVADATSVKNYLKNIDFTRYIESEEDKKVYGYVRRTFEKNLAGRAARDIVIGALIERVARTTVILNYYERLIFTSGLPKDVLDGKKGKSEYMAIQQEHRRCLESIKNLLFIEHKGKTRSKVELLRREINETL